MEAWNNDHGIVRSFKGKSFKWSRLLLTGMPLKPYDLIQNRKQPWLTCTVIQ